MTAEKVEEWRCGSCGLDCATVEVPDEDMVDEGLERRVCRTGPYWAIRIRPRGVRWLYVPARDWNGPEFRRRLERNAPAPARA